jgi:hypothetical protein
MLSSLASATASETNYRLAGIVGAAGEGALALIELPGGRQRLFREGDTLGDGRIREITAAGVRVELGHDDLLLRLRGKPILVASARDQAAAAADETEPASADAESEVAHEGERNQQLSTSEVTRLLASARNADPARAVAQSDSAETLSGQLNETLELPTDAHITAVDQLDVSTPQEAIEALASRLDQSGSARLTISAEGTVETIVLTSDSGR